MTEHQEQRWVGVNEGRDAWAGAAGEVLVEVAGHYDSVITYADLAEQVQTRTGLRTRSPYRSWVGSMLGVVVTRCRADGLPPLTSLVVHRAGGDVETEDGTVQARLACYRRYADDVPADVIAYAEAVVLAEQARAEQAARERSSKPRRQATTTRATRPAAREEEPPKICPTCFMQLPVSGVCENCA